MMWSVNRSYAGCIPACAVASDTGDVRAVIVVESEPWGSSRMRAVAGSNGGDIQSTRRVKSSGSGSAPSRGRRPRRLRRRAVARRSRPVARPLVDPGDPTAHRRRRIGLFGGTFDPPHVGHLVTAVNVRHALELDVVVLMVANVPWQKEGSRPITPGRSTAWRWSRRRSPTSPAWRPGRLEIDLGGPSYTADTLAALAEREPDAELFTIVGDDAAAGLTDLGALRGGRRAVDDGRRRPPGRAGASCPTTSPGSASRCPASRCRAPTCGPGSPTAGRSTTWSPTRCSTSSPSGACTGGTGVTALARPSPSLHPRRRRSRRRRGRVARRRCSACSAR